MPDEIVHLNKKELKKDLTIFLLIIPAIAFVLTLVYLFTYFNRYSPTAYSVQETAVLGESTDNP